MKNKPWILFSFLLISCQPTDEKLNEIDGLWCNDFEFCVYFQEDSCIIDRIWFYKYGRNGDTIFLSGSKPNNYLLTRIDEESLQIKRPGDKDWTTYLKQRQINEKVIEEISYSQISDFVEYNVNIDKTGRYEMEIQFHDTIRSGLYIGTLSPNYTRLLYEFIADMRIEMPGELKPGIISDINEWALILQEKGNKNYYL